ncbi:Bifunctional protein FolD protein [Candidatus Arcanobacter lacustris]|jgi:methylenetetrahydrofolate dehydrogenase (NADP+)/methenyltetrahydrofolate cyclohydrolase|uniref:Bifunctional protein FolD n=1 Tax=Candidatus Arcanibacter lacustris TaxID=1607817 RepID=A0A0F5MRM9_9RICK|nr:Bifunctional protein FolD protein [Candidatus Arcanobacter lacustris]
MNAFVINGTETARIMREQLAIKVGLLKEKYNLTPSLAVILVGNDPASEVYVRNKVKFSQETGIDSELHHFPADISQDDLIAKIESLNNNESIHGILIQLPLPSHINATKVINIIDSNKDVDGLGFINAGKLATGAAGLFPCTPLGCMSLIKAYIPNLDGKKAVVVGCSNIVGRPMAQMLLRHNCTVTICHSKTVDIESETSTADILVVASGKPGLVKQHWVKKGAIVIDIGITRVTDDQGKAKLYGDVSFEEVSQVAGFITPVPGGVGPMTVAYLISNTIDAACNSKQVDLTSI